MPSTLEELLKDLIDIHNNAQSAYGNFAIMTDAVRPWSSVATRTALKSASLASTATTVVSERSSATLPMEIMQELKMPLIAEEAYKFLHQFYKEKINKPFLQLKCRAVLYIENDESQNLIRLFVGSADTLKMRGNERSATFVVETIFEYQQVYTLSGDEHSTAVRIRNRKAEDFLSPPDRAQGKAIVPSISFSILPELSSGASTFTIKPEYVNVKQWAHLQTRRQA